VLTGELIASRPSPTRSTSSTPWIPAPFWAAGVKSRFVTIMAVHCHIAAPATTCWIAATLTGWACRLHWTATFAVPSC